MNERPALTPEQAAARAALLDKRIADTTLDEFRADVTWDELREPGRTWSDVLGDSR